MNHDSGGGSGAVAMMLLMMAGCMAVFVAVLLIPAVGWPVGLVLIVGAVVAMVVLHQRFMRHGGS